MKLTKDITIILYALMGIFIMCGYVANIYDLVVSSGYMHVPEVLVRIAGIFFFPLGALMGIM